MSSFFLISIIFLIQWIVIGKTSPSIWIQPVYIVFFEYDSCPISSANLKSLTVRKSGAIEPIQEYFYFCENNVPKMGDKYDCVYWSDGHQNCLEYNQGGCIQNITPSTCDEKILCFKSFDVDTYLKKMIVSFNSNQNVYAQTISIGVYNQTLENKTSQDYTCWKDTYTFLCDGSPYCQYSSSNIYLTYYPDPNQCLYQYNYISPLNPPFVKEIKSSLYQKKIGPTHSIFSSPDIGNLNVPEIKFIMIILFFFI